MQGTSPLFLLKYPCTGGNLLKTKHDRFSKCTAFGLLSWKILILMLNAFIMCFVFHLLILPFWSYWSWLYTKLSHHVFAIISLFLNNVLLRAHKYYSTEGNVGPFSRSLACQVHGDWGQLTENLLSTSLSIISDLSTSGTLRVYIDSSWGSVRCYHFSIT